ncbi:MAG: T9SS type A sorting domain-containing protein [Bacteroidetes bacterium]|nr:T9SS type A sorting domain-containing protein [Bacteroidota bacterium]
MNNYLRYLLFLVLLIPFFTPLTEAQMIKRQDAVWARETSEPIVLDGKLNEASWAKADSIHITYGVSSGLPTSGWNTDGYPNPSGYSDSLHATLKFLSHNNQLYIAFIIPDASIGGHDWPGPAWWDGVLMNVKDIRTRPVGRKEIFPCFLFTDTSSSYTGGRGKGAGPRYGYMGPYQDQLTDSMIAAMGWNMGYSIQGTSNDDSTPDTDYVFEMAINLDSLGYNTTQTNGDVVGANIQIVDADWYWQSDPTKRAVGKAWWQHPWSDQGENAGRIYIRPDVTVNSGPVPTIPPDVVVPNGANATDPTIDGNLNDPVWNGAYTLKVKYGDLATFNTYPGLGKSMSASYEVSTSNPPSPTLPQVLDPSDATVKMFFKGNYLYLAANVADQLIEGGATNQDQKDGVRFILGLRDSINSDHVMQFLNLLADFDTLGNPKADEDLDTLVKQGIATLGMQVHGTVNNNTDVDTGYTVELKIDLSKLGYANGLGDHLLFGGVDVLDADVFDNPANNYGTRTWFFKENKDAGPTAWMYMDPNVPTDVKTNPANTVPVSLVLYGNYPNPFNPSTKISYSIPKEGEVTLSIYNMLGQLVSNVNLLHQTSGIHVYDFNANTLASGVYFYRLSLKSNDNGLNYLSKTSKMILLK